MVKWLSIAFLLSFPFHQALGPSLILLLTLLVFANAATARHGLRIRLKDALFALYASAAVVASLGNFEDLTFFVRLVLYPWLITLVFQNFQYTETTVRQFFAALVCVCILVPSIMLFQVSPGSFDFSIGHLFSLNRNQGFFFLSDERLGPNAAAAMSVVAIVLLLSRIKFGARATIATYLLLAVPTLYLIVAGGRVWWAGMVLCLLLFLRPVPVSKVTLARASLTRMALLALVLGIVSATVVAGIGRNQGDILRRRIAGVVNPKADHNVQVRIVHWTRAIRLIEQRPLGWGFNYFYSRYGATPHNEVLGQAVSGGWAATALFFLLLGHIWIVIVRTKRRTVIDAQIQFAALCLLGAFSLAMVTEHVTRGTMSTFAPALWAVVGMALSGRTGSSRDGDRLDSSTPGHVLSLPREGSAET